MVQFFHLAYLYKYERVFYNNPRKFIKQNAVSYCQ